MGGIYFTEKSETKGLQSSLEVANFKPHLKSGIFNCISWIYDPIFGGDKGLLVDEGVKPNPKSPMLPFNLRTWILSLYP
jgi:hypothetical protein